MCPRFAIALFPLLPACSALITKAGDDCPDQEFLNASAFAFATSLGLSEIVYTPGAIVHRVRRGTPGPRPAERARGGGSMPVTSIP